MRSLHQQNFLLLLSNNLAMFNELHQLKLPTKCCFGFKYKQDGVLRLNIGDDNCVVSCYYIKKEYEGVQLIHRLEKIKKYEVKPFCFGTERSGKERRS